MNRTQKSIWGIASGFVFTVTSVLCWLIATPWLLEWLGEERFGTYKVLMDWMGYLILLDLGLGSGLIACLAYKVGQRDTGMVRSFLASGIRAYLWVTLAMLAGGFILVMVLPHVISLQTLNSFELRAAAMVYLLYVFLTPLLVFRSLAEAQQRQYFINLLMTTQTILTISFLLVAAKAGLGLIGLSFATVVAQIPALVILAKDGARSYGKIEISNNYKRPLKEIWKQSRQTFIHGLTDRIGIISDNIIIAWILGPVAVVPFYLTQQLAIMAQSQLKGLSNATWAGLLELYSQGKETTFRARLLELTSAVSGVAIALLIPIAAYNHHFVPKWVGNEAYAGAAVTILTTIIVWFWSIYSLWGWPLLGSGHIRYWNPYAVAFTILNVTISIFGAITIGIVGPLLGTLIGFLVVNSWALPKVLQRVFDLSPKILWRAALMPLSWGIPFGLVLCWLARTHVPRGWIDLATEMGISGLVGLFLWWMINLNKDTRKLWQTRLISVFG